MAKFSLSQRNPNASFRNRPARGQGKSAHNAFTRLAGVAAAGALAVTALPLTAHATPMRLTLTATDLTTSQVFTDTFTDSVTANLISIPLGTQGAIAFSGETALSTIAPPANALITSALTVTNTSKTDTYRLTAALSGMNFPGPDDHVAVTGAGTWVGTGGSIMTFGFYDDPTNHLGASTGTDAPGNLVGSYTSPAALSPTSSFSYSPGLTALAIPDGGLFSMTLLWNYTLLPGGTLVNRGQVETKTDIPEPGSLLLLGMGMIGVGILRSSRQHL